MSGFLLDTNVVSEPTSLQPHPAVTSFLSTHHDLWLSVVVLHELELGIRLLPEGRRRAELRAWLSGLTSDFGDRVLPVGRLDVEWAAAYRAQAHREGRRLELADALIAGAVKARDLILVTRNARDFDRLGISVLNPWEPV